MSKATDMDLPHGWSMGWEANGGKVVKVEPTMITWGIIVYNITFSPGC